MSEFKLNPQKLAAAKAWADQIRTDLSGNIPSKFLNDPISGISAEYEYLCSDVGNLTPFGEAVQAVRNLIVELESAVGNEFPGGYTRNQNLRYTIEEMKDRHAKKKGF